MVQITVLRCSRLFATCCEDSCLESLDMTTEAQEGPKRALLVLDGASTVLVDVIDVYTFREKWLEAGRKPH